MSSRTHTPRHVVEFKFSCFVVADSTTEFVEEDSSKSGDEVVGEGGCCELRTAVVVVVVFDMIVMVWTACVASASSTTSCASVVPKTSGSSVVNSSKKIGEKSVFTKSKLVLFSGGLGGKVISTVMRKKEKEKLRFLAEVSSGFLIITKLIKRVWNFSCIYWNLGCFYWF